MVRSRRSGNVAVSKNEVDAESLAEVVELHSHNGLGNFTPIVMRTKLRGI